MLCGGEKACRSHYQELRYSPTLLAGQMVNVHRVSQALNDRPSQYLGHLTSMQQSVLPLFEHQQPAVTLFDKEVPVSRRAAAMGLEVAACQYWPALTVMSALQRLR